MDEAKHCFRHPLISFHLLRPAPGPAAARRALAHIRLVKMKILNLCLLWDRIVQDGR